MAKRKPEAFSSPTEQLHAARTELEVPQYIEDEADRLLLLEKELEPDPLYNVPTDGAQRTERLYRRTLFQQSMKKARKAVAVFFLCLLVAGGTLSLSVEAVRTELSQLIYIVRERFVSLGGWGLSNGDYQAMSKLKDLYPAQVPDNLIVANSSHLTDMITIHYEGVSDSTLFVDYSANVSGTSTLVDNENSQETTVQMGTTIIRRIEKDGVITLLWGDENGYQFTISGNIPEESLLRMAESVPIDSKN